MLIALQQQLLVIVSGSIFVSYSPGQRRKKTRCGVLENP